MECASKDRQVTAATVVDLLAGNSPKQVSATFPAKLGVAALSK
jgi:hypothetical protein